MSKANRFRFRGRDTDDGTWRYGHYLEIASTMACIDRKPSKHVIVFTRCVDWGFDPNVQSEIDIKTLGQSTGLSDKNGVEIFEGDVFDCEDGEPPLVVYWHIDKAGWALAEGAEYLDDLAGYNNACVVIGNIHENPELLKESV